MRTPAGTKIPAGSSIPKRMFQNISFYLVGALMKKSSVLFIGKFKMMNIKDIRIVQKLRKGERLKEADDYTGFVTIEHFVEKTSWKLQIKRDGFAAEWEDVPIIEEYEDE
jgi:hypothetical protein